MTTFSPSECEEITDPLDFPLESLSLPDADPPVTIYVSRRVKPGCEVRFEIVLKEMTHVVERFPGYLGVTLFRPSPLDKTVTEYRIVFKFSHLSELKTWETSPERLEILSELEPLMVSPENVQQVTGLETWFTLPGQNTVKPPPRWKMAIVTGCAAYPLLNFAALYIYPPMKAIPIPIRCGIADVILISLMTWAMMPLMTRLFSRWLYPQTK